jgi:protein disulfide-isomerase
MKRAFLSLLMALAILPLIQAQDAAPRTEGELTWYTSLPQAHKLSEASKKPIFAFFTGSDWCGWCKKLQRDVFAKPEFIAWAKQNVILLELDFPRTKQLPPELAQQNNSLQQALGVGGYPTIWLLYATLDEKTKNYNLNAIGSVGYPRDAVPGNEQAKFLQDITQVLNQKKAN